MIQSFVRKSVLCMKCQVKQAAVQRQHSVKHIRSKSYSQLLFSWKRDLDKKKAATVGIHTSKTLSLNFSDEDQISTEEDKVLDDKEYANVLREYHKIPNTGHRLLVIHPAIRWGPKKPEITMPDLELEEACTLVNTLRNWKVVEQRIVKVASISTRFIFGTQQFHDLADEVHDKKTVSAVFLNVGHLNAAQIAEFQKHWKIPVFDRYSIILQIFKEHAKTKVAKLQVALAEIPYIRGRMGEIQTGQEDEQIGYAEIVGGRGLKFMHIRRRLLHDREAKLRKALYKVRQQREMIRKTRKKKELPTVAVVGYTNSGKTTLIKALTGDRDMIPENFLFATLDVTAHGGLLPNNMSVVYMDTVGFIANLHHKLLDAFSATLEDALEADLVIHVRDISHPDTYNQKENVLNTLKEKLTDEQMKNIIEVCNKADKIPQSAVFDNEFPVSAVTGQGLEELLNMIQQRLLNDGSTYLQKKMKIPSTGDHLGWLCQEAKVNDVETDSDGNLIVDIVITKTAYEKFKSRFLNQRTAIDYPKIKRR